MRKDPGASRSALKRMLSGGVVLALAALFGLPVPAFAAGVTEVELNGAGTILTATAATIQVNSITVGNTGPVAGGGISIKDTGPAGDGVNAGPLAEAAGCNDTVTDQVRCPFGDITLVVVNAGDSNDLIIVLNDDVPTTANAGDGNDDLRGGGASDTLNGDGGNDTIVGGFGADILNGGTGGETGAGDVVDYGSSQNAVDVSLDGVANDGQDTDDVLIGIQPEGDNVTNFETVEGSSHDDILTGSAGADRLIGNAGNDDLNGLAGNDTLMGETGEDDYDGGGDIDTVSYGNESEDVVVTVDNVADDGAGCDADLSSPCEEDNVRTTVETVVGGIGDDSLTGGAGAQTLRGSGGNDVINGDVGNDVLEGGTGNDWVSYEGRAGAVNASLDGVNNDGESGETDNIAGDVENLLGGLVGDTLTGNAGPNKLDGGPGGDTLDGAGGNDTLIGTTGDAGDNLIGGTGTDEVTYAAALAGSTVSLDNNANDNGEGDNVRSTVENVTGSDFVDTITGSGARNVISGGCGGDHLFGDPVDGSSNDTLNGGPGDDDLHGIGGADVLNGGNGPDATLPTVCGVVYTDADDLDGGLGSDSVSYSNRSAAVTVTIGAGANDGESGEGDEVFGNVERLTGGSGADTLTGNTGLDRINGGGGGDDIFGGGGGDILSGQGGDDDITGNSGKDTMSGAAGDDKFFAQDGVKDSVSCGDGNDTVVNKDPIDSIASNCNP